jgi:hypothetical protein
MPTPSEPRVTPDTHCEWCGAPFEAPQSAEPRRAQRPPEKKGVAEYAPTHCEWCGAEYPEPGGAPHVHPPA